MAKLQQTTMDKYESSASDRTQAFPGAVVAGNMIHVFSWAGGDTDFVIQDTLGNTYTRVAMGDYLLWHCVSAFSGANSIIYHRTTGSGTAIMVGWEDDAAESYTVQQTGFNSGGPGTHIDVTLPAFSGSAILCIALFLQAARSITIETPSGTDLGSAGNYLTTWVAAVQFEFVNGDGVTAHNMYWDTNASISDWLAFGYAITVATPPPDETPPSKPANVRKILSNAAGTSVRLAWNPSTDNDEVTGYKVKVDGGSAAPLTVAFTDETEVDVWADVTGFTTNTEHTFQIAAVDFAENVSTYSDLYTTSSGLWTTRPPVAKWVTPNLEEFAHSLWVGVDAMHPQGTERVEFSVNNSAHTFSVSSRSINADIANPFTDVGATESCPIATFNIQMTDSYFISGSLTLHATAIPTTGEPLALPMLTLYTSTPTNTIYVAGTTGNDGNPGTIGSPVQTLEAAFGLVTGGEEIIVTEAGDYFPDRLALGGGANLDNTRNVKVRRAVGLTRSQVVIKGHLVDGTRVRMVPRIKCLRFDGFTFDQSTFLWMETGDGQTTLRDFRLHDPNGASYDYSQAGYTEFVGDFYLLEGTIDDCRYGATWVSMARNMHVIGALDAFQGCRFAFWCRVSDMDFTEEERIAHHPDVKQDFGDQSNVLVHGLRGHNLPTCQGIFINQSVPSDGGQKMINSAFIDLDLPVTADIGYISQMQGFLEGVWLQNVNLGSQVLMFRNDAAAGNNRYKGQEFVISASPELDAISLVGDLPPSVVVLAETLDEDADEITIVRRQNSLRIGSRSVLCF